MGGLHKSHDQAFVIPSVDISAYLTDPNSKEGNKVIEQVRDACRTSGFFQITGHGVPPSLRDSVLDAAKTFFALPSEQKVKYSGVPGRGYEKIGEQMLEPGTKPELKEGYFVGREDSSRKPPYREFEHPNIWPTEVVSDASFKNPLLRYHDVLSALARTMMVLLGRGLSGVDTSIFDVFCKDPVASVRLLHYPPHPTNADPNLRGAGAHTDFGAITLLLQDDASGLQVFNRHTEAWIDVQPNKDAYVVNVGDMLEKWTNGEYNSTLHRVINTSGKERYSVPFFYDGNLDCELKPLDGSSATGITVEQIMRSRYEASYIK